MKHGLPAWTGPGSPQSPVRLCEASGVVEVGTRGDEREWFCGEPATVQVKEGWRAGDWLCPGHAAQDEDSDRMWPL